MTQAYRTHLRDQLFRYGVPHRLREGLVEYLTARRPTGDFLKAVLSNDLTDAALRADEVSGIHLVPIVKFLAHCAPAEAWGSGEAITAWLADPNPVPEIFE